VHYLGFVPDNEIVYIYKQSIALVMPTYFGPTNIPPLEAFALGVPVLYSDLPEFVEPLGNASLPLNLEQPECLSEHLVNLLSDPELKNKLIKNGKDYLKERSENNYAQVFEKIINEYSIRMKCWKH
jgi:glycosyltransferase involved in cell wall biosynthesis